MDVKSYLEKKEKGLVSIAKLDGEGSSFAVATKRFDPATGARLSDEVIGVTKQELLDRKSVFQAEITALETVIAELEALEA